jgi:hypothetical protein
VVRYEFMALVVGVAVVVVGIAPFIRVAFAATSLVAQTAHDTGNTEIGRALQRRASHHDQGNQGSQDRAALRARAVPSHDHTLRCHPCGRSGGGGYVSSILSSNQIAGLLGR